MDSGDAIRYASDELQHDRSIVIEAMLERHNTDARRGTPLLHLDPENPLLGDKSMQMEVHELRLELEETRREEKSRRIQALLAKATIDTVKNIAKQEEEKARREKTKTLLRRASAISLVGQVPKTSGLGAVKEACKGAIDHTAHATKHLVDGSAKEACKQVCKGAIDHTAHAAKHLVDGTAKEACKGAIDRSALTAKNLLEDAEDGLSESIWMSRRLGKKVIKSSKNSVLASTDAVIGTLDSVTGLVEIP